MRRAVIGVLFVSLLFAFTPVFAQNHGTIEGNTFGLTFFTGLSLDDGPFVGNDETAYRYYGIGLAYHPFTFLAIEAGFFHKKGDSKNEGSSGGGPYSSESEYSIYGYSIGLYYYHEVGGGMYLYAGPRLENAKREYSNEDSTGYVSETEESSDMLSLIIGVKYLFNDHIGIFADIGIGRNSTTQDSESKSGGITSNSYTESSHIAISRSLIGVVFYF
ncbi:MAG: hypothetical protein KBA61_06210 [Spirochaetes bacterium]|nr:hypothetical protein [Spirochaetota bacterium]